MVLGTVRLLCSPKEEDMAFVVTVVWLIAAVIVTLMANIIDSPKLLGVGAAMILMLVLLSATSW